MYHEKVVPLIEKYLESRIDLTQFDIEYCELWRQIRDLPEDKYWALGIRRLEVYDDIFTTLDSIGSSGSKSMPEDEFKQHLKDCHNKLVMHSKE